MIKLMLLKRGDYPGLSDGPHLISHKSPCKVEGGSPESENEMRLQQRSKWGEATRSPMWTSPRSWKSQANDFSLRASRRKAALLTP